MTKKEAEFGPPMCEWCGVTSWDLVREYIIHARRHLSCKWCVDQIAAAERPSGGEF